MKRILSFLLAALMLVGLFAGCSKSEETPAASETTAAAPEETPVTSEEATEPAGPVDITIAIIPQDGAVDFDPANNWYCQYLEKSFPVNITWEVISPSAAQDRVSLMLNTGDFPDAILGFYMDTSAVVLHGQINEVIRPINDLLQYMPNLSAYLDSHEGYEAMLKASDGNIYGFPCFNNTTSTDMRFYLNTTWLKNVGKEMPTTLPELKEVLIAFRDQDANGNGDANDEIPWSGVWSEEQSERNMLLNANALINCLGDEYALAVDYSTGSAQLACLPYSEGYKAYLQFANECWEEGLMDKAMFTQAVTEHQATVRADKTGFTEMSSVVAYDADRQMEWDINSLYVAAEGQTPVFPDVNPVIEWSVTNMVLNANIEEEKAIAIAQMIDWNYSLEGYMMCTYGPEAGTELDWNNYGYTYDEEQGKIVFPNRPADMDSDWTHRITNTTLYNSPGYQLAANDEKRLEYAAKYPDSAVGKLYANGITYDRDVAMLIEQTAEYKVPRMPGFFFTPEDAEELAFIKTPLMDYIKNAEAKFITGELDLASDWDAFIETCKTYGLDDYFEIYNKYFDAYLNG